MKIEIKGGMISGVEGGMLLSNARSLDLRMENVMVTSEQGLGFKVEATPTLIEQIGLPTGTSESDLLEALKILQEVRQLPIEQQVEKLRGSKLADKALSVGANLATLATSLMSLLDKVKF